MNSESSRLTNMIAAGRANESGRVAAMIRRQKECMAPEIAAKAAYLSQRNCEECVKLDLSGAFLGNTINKPVPQSSSKLQSDQVACALRGGLYVGPDPTPPASVQITAIQQRTLDLATDFTNPYTRFSMYRRPFIPLCPPIPQSYLRAGEPVLQGKSCGLPNKPDNPVLPG